MIGCSVRLNTEAAESPASNRQGVDSGAKTVLIQPPVGARVSAQEKRRPVTESHGGRKAFARQIEAMDDALDTMTAEQFLVKALRFMDEAVLKELNQSEPASPEAINRELRGWITGKHGSDESYEIVAMGVDHSWYALVAKLEVFSALRFYAKRGISSSYGLVAKLDPSTSPDSDDYRLQDLKFLIIDQKDGVFVTSFAARSFLQGYCAAWQFDGEKVRELWNSGRDHIFFEKVIPEGIVLKHCDALTDDNCKNPAEVRYIWSEKAWKKSP